MTDTATKPSPHDLPETFTIADLEATGSFDPAEIEAIKKDEELFSNPQESDTGAALEGDEDAALAAADAAKAPAPEPEQRPAMADVPDTSAAEARITEIKASRADLTKRYDEGELTQAEMQAELDKLIDQQAAAMAEIKRAEEVIVTNQRTAEQRWMESLEAFKAQGNSHLFDGEHREGFDKALRTVTGDPDNANLPFPVMISMAAQQHAITYQARTGKAVEVKTASGKPAPGTGEQRRGPRQDARPDPIETLSGLNAPGDEMVRDSTFTAIDNIANRDPLAAEEHLRRMSPEEQDRFLGIT